MPTLPPDASEHLHQAHLVSWFRKTYPGVLIFAIPNGGKRGKREAMKLKVEGVTAGIPDLCAPEFALFVEMKKPGGRLSKDQKLMIPRLESAGQTVLVGVGFEDARDQISGFMASRKIQSSRVD